MDVVDEEDVELDSWSDTMDDSPDDPLIRPTASSAPRWLRPSPRRQQWGARIAAFFAAAAAAAVVVTRRPRIRWRYRVLSAFIFYALACLVRRVPLFASPLPGYTGPHAVGAVDVEVPLDTPRRVSETRLKGTGEPAFEVETVLFTLYYPVAEDAKATRPNHLWIPKPVSLTAEGYATLARVNNFIVRPILTLALWLIAGGIQIPARVDAPLLPSGAALPVMVFSHGMASSRTDYTSFLGELASRGHVVAAVEHRDGSSPGSLIRFRDAARPARKVLPLREADLESDPPMDTPTLKREQLAFRDVEIAETARVLRAIADGGGEAVFRANARDEGTHLAAWKGRLDMKQYTIGGHSYGATGALQALRGAPSPSNPAVGGLILDPGKSSGPLSDDVGVPVLVVHSNSWSRGHSLFYGRPHFDAVRDLVGSVMSRAGAAWFVTSIGTSHPSVTDAPLLEPLLLSWTTGATIDVKEALNQYVLASMDFFNFLERGDKTGLLAERVTHREYGRWVTQERRHEFPEELAKYWEVHVSPVGEK